MHNPTFQEVQNWTNHLSSTPYRSGPPSYEELRERMSPMPTHKLRALRRSIARFPERSVVDLDQFQAIDAILNERRRARGDV